MFKCLIQWILPIAAITLISLTDGQSQTLSPIDRDGGRRPTQMLISLYEDDPFACEPIVRRMIPSKFNQGDNGSPLLSSDVVKIQDENFIYRLDKTTGNFAAFAWNPWPAPTSNRQGDFRFQDEDRYPLLRVERGPDGKIVLKEGLQLWLPQDLHLGMTTAFNAAHSVKEAAETWSGRDLVWGVKGMLEINTHAFIDFNAFYSPSGRMLFFGVLPYRFPGQTDVKIFEMAASWEIAAHESGHAVLHALKPNLDPTDQGFKTWGESFGDQTAMWASLRNRDRISRLLAETNGELNQSSSLTRLVEAYATLVGIGDSQRNAFHEKKVSETSVEVHDRSEVFTGASYKLFVHVYSKLKNEQGIEERAALSEAGRIMGTFLTRAADYLPENRITLEDVGKAYLKVDKEFYGGRYQAMLLDEFIRREVFDADSVSEWMAHEATLPVLVLPQRSPDKVKELVQASLDHLGLGQDFGLKVQGMIRDERHGQTIVRVQLTLGRGDDATPLKNHGILVFRANDTLADYHAPLPPSRRASLQPELFLQMQATTMISQAKRLNLDRYGVPLSIVCSPDGQLSVEAQVLRGDGVNAYIEVFTLDNPRGERREIVVPPTPPHKGITIPDEIIN